MVDVIFGGSPCQDLSIAGNRKGMKHTDRGDDETTRSGLFMEQIRIVKEMRERDRANGNDGVLTRPRYMVWENVPGAFSSGQPKGSDFAAVIEEIIKVAEPGACVCVCVPDKGWSKAGCYYADDGSWSIAWRTHDAQYFGVPQRRRRISLVADFNGLTAPSILFDYEYRGEAARAESYQTERHSGDEPRPEVQPVGESVSGNPEPGGTQGQAATHGTESGADGAISFQERAGKPGGGKGILIQHDRTGCLSTLNNQSVLGFTNRGYESGEITETLRALPHGAYPMVSQSEPTVLESNQNHATITNNGVSPTLPASMGMGGGYVPMVSGTLNPGAHPGSYNGQDAYNDLLVSPPPRITRRDSTEAWEVKPETSDTNRSGQGHSAQGSGLTASYVDCRNGNESPDVNGTLQAKSNGGYSYNCGIVIRTNESSS